MKMNSSENTGSISSVGSSAEFVNSLHERCPHVYATLLLTILNSLAFIFIYVFEDLNFLKPSGNLVLLKWGANYALFTANGEAWRLVTYSFIHFGIIHLGMNMLCLYLAGQIAERLYSFRLFLTVYLFSAVSGGLGSLFVRGGAFVGGGASGAVFGVVGALVAFILLRRQCFPKPLLKSLWGTLISFIVFNFAVGFFFDQIDNGAHAGGFIAGIIAGSFICLMKFDLKAVCFKGVLITFLFSGLIVLVVWKPIMRNSRLDADCRMAVNSLEIGDDRLVSNISSILQHPVASIADVSTKADLIGRQSLFWSQIATKLEKSNRPGWPLNRKIYKLQYQYCVKRFELVSEIANSLKFGSTKKLYDSISKINDEIRRLKIKIKSVGKNK